LRWTIGAEANVNLCEDFGRVPMSIDRLVRDTSFRPRFDLPKAFAELTAERLSAS
jgi:hypothetical protein